MDQESPEKIQFKILLYEYILLNQRNMIILTGFFAICTQNTKNNLIVLYIF